MSLRERAEAAVPYVVGGAKLALSTASAITSFVEPPGVQKAIDLALQIVAALEVSVFVARNG